MKKLLLAAFLLFSFAAPVLAGDEYASVYDRVVKTRTLRCAYTLYPTFVEKDPNTGEMSGMGYEIANAVGKELGIKIEWTDEAGLDVIFEGFKNHRYDMACAGYSLTPSRAWAADATIPTFFAPYNLYVRAEESRFKSFEDLNNPDVSIVGSDGYAGSAAALERFPKAQHKSLPGLTPATDRFEMVAAGKADVTPMEAGVGAEYMTQNPGKIRQFGDAPMSVMASALFIPKGETQLKALLDVGIQSLQNSGALERIIKKYEKHPGEILLPALPYQLPGPVK